MTQPATIERWSLVAVHAVAAVLVVSAAGCQSADPSIDADATPTPSGTIAGPPLRGGDVIVFERTAPGAEEPDLYAVGLDGGEPRLLQSPGGYPHWSPDGSELAFSACLNPPACTTAVALMERSTGDVHGLSMPDPDLFTVCVAWAPSGNELACEGFGNDDPTRNGVYTIRASDGEGLTRITRNPDGDDIPLAYSPDGSQLLIDRTDPSRDEPENRALFVTPTGGGQPHRITPWGFTDDLASWSPDGSTIVFETNGSLYRVSPEGQGLAGITLQMPDGSSPVSAFDVSFSPDGQRLVFSLAGSAPGIYTARADGSEVERLTVGDDHHANWGAASGS